MFKEIRISILASIVLLPLLLPLCRADISLDAQFVNPLGEGESWDFEGENDVERS